MANNNSSKKTIILGAITFWLFGYVIAAIILFLEINFDVVWYKDSFLSLLFRPFFYSVGTYSPFYVLPLLLAGYLARRWREKKKLYYDLLTFILPLFSSLLIAFPFFVFLSLCAADNSVCRAELRIFEILFLFQLVFCLILSDIFNYQKEKIIPKVMLIGLIFFFGIVSYISVWAKTASNGVELSKNIAQEAIKVKDTSLCEKIFEEGKKRKIYSRNAGSLTQNAYLKCISQIAIDTRNIQLCEKLKKTATGGYSFCLGEFARTTSDPNLCVQNILKEPEEYSELKIGWCFKVIFTHPTYSTDPKICEKVEEKWKRSCYNQSRSTEPPPRWMDEIRK